MQYVVVQIDPERDVTVYGPFTHHADARAHAQMLSDERQEDGPGFRHVVRELNETRQ